MHSTFALMFTYCVVTNTASHLPSPVKTPLDLGVVAELNPVELAVVERTNTERARQGLRPLVVDRRLMRSARRHCAWMTNAGSLTHTTAPVGENIAMGQTSSSEAVQSWMNSPGHRANVLNASYRKIGVAAYRTHSGTVYWCQQFN